jgi:hypothetical protein
MLLLRGEWPRRSDDPPKGAPKIVVSQSREEPDYDFVACVGAALADRLRGNLEGGIRQPWCIAV